MGRDYGGYNLLVMQSEGGENLVERSWRQVVAQAARVAAYLREVSGPQLEKVGPMVASLSPYLEKGKDFYR